MGFAGDQPNRDNIDFTPVGSVPSNASEGATIYHSTSGLIFYTGTEWVATSGGGSASLSGLTDTTLSSLTSGDAIRWNGSEWVNQQDGTPAVPAVSDLDDTTITSVASGDVLTWNGAGLWVNEAGGGGSLSGLSDTTLTAPASGSILSYNGSEWIDAGAPIEVQTSGYVRTLVASGSVSAGTSFDTPTLAGLGYESVEVLINNIDVSTDMYFKATAINASDTELTGASDYGYQSDGADQPDGSAWGAGSKAAAFIGLAYVGGTAASRFGAGTDNKGHASIRYKNISEHAKNPTTSPAVFDTAATYIKSGQGGRASTWTGGGWYNPSSAANALDSIRIATNTGTWTGNWQVWADVPMSVLVTEAAAVTALSDLSDTTTTAPASGEVLQYDGSTWANAALAEIPTSGYQWKLLESKSAATAGTSVSFTGLEDYSAREIRIVGQGLELGGKDADYKIEMLLGGTDDVVNTGAADYMRSNWNLFNTTNSNAGDFADDSIVINTTTSEAGGSLELMDFDCKITGIDAANHAFVNIEGLSVHNNSSAPNAFNVKARHNVLEELGVVQILHQDVTDVWTGGTFDLWGLVPISVVVSNAQVATATTTELVDNSHSINTSGLKVAGYMVFNTTTGAPVWSVGSADGSIWNDSTGSTKHTPV